MGSAIGMIATGILAIMMLQMGFQIRGGLAEASLQADSGLVQDRLVNLLRPMSASQSVIFGDPVPGAAGLYRRIVVARGENPAYPREEIYFNTNTFALFHDPNRAVASNEVTVFSSGQVTKLRNIYFFPSLKPGGIPDDATLNVGLVMDDSAYATPKNATGGLRKTNTVSRYFTIRMRAS